MGEVWRVDMKEGEGETGRRGGGQLGGCIREGEGAMGRGRREGGNREGETGRGRWRRGEGDG